MPDGGAGADRLSIEALIDVSVNALDDLTKAVFFAFGAMFTPSATPELLALFFMDKPEATPEQITHVRPQLPEDIRDKLSDEQVTEVIVDLIYHQELPQYIEAIEKALQDLQTRGLATYIPPTEEAAAYYRVHDLAHSYTRSQNGDDDNLTRTLHACLAYTRRYNEPSLANFKALRPELDNFLSAAQWAFQHEYFAEVELFASNFEFIYAESNFELSRVLHSSSDSA